MTRLRFPVRGLLCALAASALALSAGCQRESGASQRVERTEPSVPVDPARTEYNTSTGASTVARYTGAEREANDEAAIRKLAPASCAREQACDHVGAGKRWQSEEACESDLIAMTVYELNAGDCPNGVDQRKLSDCVDSMQSEACGRPPVTLISKMFSCHSGDLCEAAR